MVLNCSVNVHFYQVIAAYDHQEIICKQKEFCNIPIFMVVFEYSATKTKQHRNLPPVDGAAVEEVVGAAVDVLAGEPEQHPA